MEGSRPIETSSLFMGKVFPESGPAMTSSLASVSTAVTRRVAAASTQRVYTIGERRTSQRKPDTHAQMLGPPNKKVRSAFDPVLKSEIHYKPGNSFLSFFLRVLQASLHGLR